VTIAATRGSRPAIRRAEKVFATRARVRRCAGGSVEQRRHLGVPLGEDLPHPGGGRVRRADLECGGEPGRVHEHLSHVVVPADHPDAERLRVVDGLLLAQAPVERVGIGEVRGAEAVEREGGGHRILLCERSADRIPMKAPTRR
jgi:hypothetical protein